MKRFKRIILVLLGLVLVALFVLAAKNLQAIRGAMVHYSDFKQIHERLYVSPGTRQGQIDSLLELIPKARMRNHEFWQGNLADPLIIFCHNDSLVRLYGGGPAAAFIMSPFFSYVVVGPDGIDFDVLSHELCHPELFARMGWMRHEFFLPVWFFEGLAMQVDERRAYSEAAWMGMTRQGKEAPDIHQLETREQFFSFEEKVYLLHYATAKAEVKRWLDIVGFQGLQELIRRSEVGEDFYALYQDIENRALQARP